MHSKSLHLKGIF